MFRAWLYGPNLLIYSALSSHLAEDASKESSFALEDDDRAPIGVPPTGLSQGIECSANTASPRKGRSK
jgi:hypothetical protein